MFVISQVSHSETHARTHTHTQQVPAADASLPEIRLDVRAISADDDFLSLRTVTPLALRILEMCAVEKRQTLIYRDAEYGHTDAVG